MLIVALVLAVIGLAALVTAVVTSNELIAWVCIGASVIGVLLLIVDAVRERSRGAVSSTGESDGSEDAADTDDADARASTEATAITEVIEPVVEDYPDDAEAEVGPPDDGTVAVVIDQPDNGKQN